MSGPRKIIESEGPGFFKGISNHLKLVWQLWLDPNINPLLKLLPLGSLIYLVFPIDIPGPIDDIGVIWFFTYMFVELCPPEIVAQHRAEIEGINIAREKESQEIEINEDDIIDAAYKEKKDE